MGAINNRGGGGSETFQDVYNASSPPEIAINAAKGAVVLGLASGVPNATKLLEFENNSGTTTGFVRGDGLADFSEIVYTPDSSSDWTTIAGSVPNGVFEALDLLVDWAEALASSIDGDYVNVTGDIMTGALTINDSTDASSISTGALIISGGVGIAKSLYIGDVTGSSVSSLGIDGNGKVVSTGTAAVSGTGTANQVTYWSGANSLTGSSVFTFDGSDTLDFGDSSGDAILNLNYDTANLGANVAEINFSAGSQITETTEPALGDPTQFKITAVGSQPAIFEHNSGGTIAGYELTIDQFVYAASALVFSGVSSLATFSAAYDVDITAGLYIGDTTGGAPVSGLALDSSGKVVTGTLDSIAGSDTQVQFNDGGSHGADSSFTFEKTTNTLTIGQPGGPEGYGYGYGEDNASIGSFILYGDLYVDDDATFAENVVFGSRLQLTGIENNVDVADGDFWLDQSSGKFSFRQNGATITLPNNNPIDGSGTTNQVAYWSDSDTITGDSNFTWDGSTLAIGATTVSTSTTSGALTVSGGLGVADDAYINDYCIVDNTGIHVSSVGTDNTSDSGVHINGPGQDGASSTGGIVLTQGSFSERRLSITANDGRFNFKIGSYSTTTGELQIKDNEIGVAGEFNIGVEDANVLTTSENISFHIHSDTSPPTHAAATDTDAYVTYFGTQLGGALSVASGTDGGDLILALGTGNGTGRDGIFEIQGNTHITTGGDLTIDNLAGSAGTLVSVDANGQLQLSGSSGSLTNSYKTSFTNASLSGGVLTVNHSLGTQYNIVQVYDENDQLVVPDDVTLTDSNNLDVDLGTFGAISGTWNVIVIG